MNLMRKLGLCRRSILTIMTVMVLLLAWGLPVFAQGANDVSGHWAGKQISAWQNQGLIKGYADGSFRPDAYVTRAEFMAMVNNVFGYTEKAEAKFTDVKAGDWFAGEVAKSKAVGYIAGNADGTMRPNSPISRQEAAVVISKFLKMDTAGISSNKEFRDVGSFPDWSKSSIAAVANSGYMAGYPDGSYRAGNNITRAEAVTALAKVAGTLYNIYGTYGAETGTQTVSGNVTISKPDVTLKNTIIDGNLYLTEGIGEGHVTLDNVTVKGNTVVSGGGINSIIIINTKLGPVNIEVPDGAKVRLVASGTSRIGAVTSKTNAKLEESNLSGEGFVTVAIPSMAEVDLVGHFSDIKVTGQKANINVNGTVDSLTVDSAAKNTKIEVAAGSKVDNLTLNAAAAVGGTGTIKTANLNVSGSTIETKPANTVTAPGVTGTVGGTKVGGSTTTTPGSGSSGSSGGSDTTALAVPVVTGISEGATVLGALPMWTNAAGTTTTAMLNGQPYIKGTSIHVNGAYILVVTATKTSNSTTASKTINFTVANTGTEQSPYPIFNAADLNAIRGGVAGYEGWDLTKAYKQLANVDLAVYGTGSGWEPIGGNDDFDTYFTGSFDGNGFTIDHLYIDRPDNESIGLFGYANNGTIQNVTLTNADVTGESDVGGIVGYSGYLNIINCSASGDIKATDSSTGGIIGGLDDGTITNCYFNGNVSAYLGSTGGLAGDNGGTIQHSYANSNVSGYSGVGGLVGYNWGTIDISNFVLGGSVTCADNSVNDYGETSFGRIAGYNDGGTAAGTATADVKFYANPMADVSSTFPVGDGVNGTDAANPIEFTGWDFTDTWQDNNGTPIFKWQAANEYPAVPFIRGITYGAEFYYATPTWADEDGITTSAVISKDGGASQAFAKGTMIETAGTYELKVTATKTANGLKTGSIMNFAIIRTSPETPVITGVTEGQEFYAKLPSPEWSTGSATLSKDGGDEVPYDASLLAGVGRYVLKVNGKSFTYPDAIATVSFYVYGAGTEAEPFLISTPEQLQEIDPNWQGNDFSDWGAVWNQNHDTVVRQVYYELENDLDLSGYDSWEPVGNSAVFYGHFDGQGYTISSMTINDGENYYTGLFGRTGDTAEISDLNLSNVDITASGGNTYTGGLVGMNAGLISNCTVSGDIRGTNWLGGLVGDNQAYWDGTDYTLFGIISNCSSSVNIDSDNVTTSYRSSGGLVGQNNGRIEGSSASGIMTGGSFMGGLVGDAGFNSYITQCSATGAISGYAYLGGLVAQNGGVISKSYATGDVTGPKADILNYNIGGLIGINTINFDGSARGDVDDCYATGNVVGNNAVGGLSGGNFGTITNCYAAGNADSLCGAGGIIGGNGYGDHGVVENCFALNGRVTRQEGWTPLQLRDHSSGSVGKVANTLYSYYDQGGLINNYAVDSLQLKAWVPANSAYTDYTQLFTGANDVDGAVVTAADAKKANTYDSAGWDMTNTWIIDEGNAYPTLQ